MNIKNVIVISALVAAVAWLLAAVRSRPMKLGAGADLPVAEKVAR